MILFLTTADTEVLAARRAAELLPPGFPEVLAANPVGAGAAPVGAGANPAAAAANAVGAAAAPAAAQVDPVGAKMAPAGAQVDSVGAGAAADASRSPAAAWALDGVRVVLVRLLGGRRAWDGFDALRARCVRDGVPLLAFSGEAAPDAELTALSTAPAGVVAEAFTYLVQGGVDNTANLFRFVADTLLRTGFGFAAPATLPEEGVWGARPRDRGRPMVGIVFYRTHWMSGNTAFVAALCDAVEAAGANALPVFAYSLRPRDGRVPALELLEGVDTVVLTVLAMGGSTAADAEGWSVPALEALGVPVVQAVCATSTRAAWAASDAGLSPLDVAMQVALPEFDGRVVTVPFTFKETGGDGTVTYVADPGRTTRVAGIAVRLARLRHTPNAAKRVAVMLSNYPTRHSRVGNAVGLDTPASAVRLLDALTAAGYDTGDWPGLGWDGDRLVHALIAAGGYDEEFLTAEQVAANPARVDAGRYAGWFARLPADLRQAVERRWGPPPGELYRDGDDLVVAGLELGNVFLGIQPPRGFGENPVAIYHDPDLAPTHHYLAAYRWLDQEWGADAVVHLGKHGTLEWLPGKSLGLSGSCAPDAVLGDLPLLYPFVVNDPGEGTQAKRRAHAVVVDHLVPPMTRAETYDDLARLEQLLDEYAQVSALAPAKVPALRARIWQLLVAAELHRDLGVDAEPDDFDEFVLHVDGYLCEIKDAQIRGGLHVLGQAPTGEARLGLVLAILRLPQAGLPGLREALGLDVAAADRATVDRVEAEARALVEAMDAKGWDPAVAGALAEGAVADVLRFAATEVVPRLAGTDREIARLLDGLAGRYVPAGPSGSPTRGRVDVLPTGKNFYSVDPKALPSELSWQVGQKLAEDLCARYRRETGQWPASIGIVVWGTSAMRTHGDDVAEILALLGVRPVWHPETRRVTGLELVPLEQLGRPRVDVTVRISGFFRDAFPHLVQLVDDAVALVAGQTAEPAGQNPVVANVAADLAAGVAARRATARVFGSKPGAYGAGLLPLIDARNWQTDADLAEVYATWGGYAYGRGLDGAEARQEMARTFGRIRVAVKNTDTREHDLFDSDDYFQYHGGMVAAVRALTGRSPKAYVGDSHDPARPATRDLREETARVFRSRVANPKWIQAMRRHGYKGAFELSATVDYLFGYDATAGVVEDWMYQQLSERYVFDAEVRAFMRRSNPWALRAVTERLLEAADRRLWAAPDPDTLERLQATYLELEGELEDREPD
jgi:cobaltochelatase CobN